MHVKLPILVHCRRLFGIVSLAICLSFAAGLSAANASAYPGLANETILIIRHAEKPDDGSGLAPAGVQRAQLYVQYFKTFTVDGAVDPPTYLIASADSKHSQRPRLTITPLSQALHLPIDTRFSDDDYASLASALQTSHVGKVVLIAWHHEEIANLLSALGADPTVYIPRAKWPGDVYNWVIELQYDSSGNLITSKSERISEHLLPGDN